MDIWKVLVLSIFHLPYRKGSCNAVVLWMDYSLDEDITISTGLEDVSMEVRII